METNNLPPPLCKIEKKFFELSGRSLQPRLMASFLEGLEQNSFPHCFITRMEINSPPPSLYKLKDQHHRMSPLSFLQEALSR